MIPAVYADMVAPVFVETKPGAVTTRTAPVISQLVVLEDNASKAWIEINVTTPPDVLDAIRDEKNYPYGKGEPGYIDSIQLQYLVENGMWKESILTPVASNDNTWSGTFKTEIIDGLHSNLKVKAKARYVGGKGTKYEYNSNWSNELEILPSTIAYISSDWATPELSKADSLNMIPNRLKTIDFTKPITREEFAEISVKAYEAFTEKKAEAVSTNPFIDTQNAEVLKAYHLGITTGTSDNTFEPDAILNREQAATMLTRVYKKATINGWTIKDDSKYPLKYIRANTFADDNNISDWAKESVYFMNANGIIKGIEDNKFAPQNMTEEEEKSFYANATREQAIVIAVRMIENLEKGD